MVFFFETVCIILLRSSQKWHRLFSFFHPGGMSASSSETDVILALGVSQKRHRGINYILVMVAASTSKEVAPHFEFVDRIADGMAQGNCPHNM